MKPKKIPLPSSMLHSPHDPRPPLSPGTAKRLRLQASTKAAAVVVGAAMLMSTLTAAAEDELALPPDQISGATILTQKSASAGQGARRVVTIAELDILVNPYDAFMLKQTVAALQKQLPTVDIRRITITAAEAKEQIERAKPDFLFAPAAFQGMAGVEASRIATRRTHLARKAEESVGAAVVVRSGSGFQKLDDLKGRRIIAGLPSAVDGWLALARELVRRGEDPEKYFAGVAYCSNAYPDALSMLLNNSADAAVLPACLLEAAQENGLIDPTSVRVLGNPDGALVCAHSTALYPDLSLLSLSTAPEEAVREMTVALLSLGANDDYEWLTNVSHSEVDRLMKDLEIGPYAYLRDMSMSGIWQRHRGKILAVLGVIIFLILNELRLHRLVRRRTAELARAMEERGRLAEEASAARFELAKFERRSIVSQMSSMIAHEINAPVGAVRTWAAVLRIKCPPSVFRDDASAAASALEDGLKRIDREADRIAGIVSRVRAYAKRELEPQSAVDVRAILEKAVRAYRAEERTGERAEIRLESRLSAAAPKESSQGAPPPAFVLGHPLELEILFLNLIRNGAKAMKAASKASGTGLHEPAQVLVRLEAATAGGRWRVTVENPGAPLTDEALAKLNARASGIAVEPSTFGGLGLGLSICRGIADRHGASLRFEAREGGGARAVVEIDRLAERTDAEDPPQNEQNAKQQENNNDDGANRRTKD